CQFVVKAQAVVAGHTGARLGEFAVDARAEFCFDESLRQSFLRAYAGDRYCAGIGQKIGRGLAIKLDGIIDDIQIKVGTDTGKLAGAVTAWVAAEGFIVVPEDTVQLRGVRQFYRGV